MRAWLKTCFRTKRVEGEIRRTDPECLRRVLTVWELISIGIGCMVGVGIFVLPGVEAARHAGPGIILSFAIAATAAALAALAYAELAALIPATGSTYAYIYATMGELPAWTTAWALIFEYVVAAGIVAVGWSAYLTNLISSLGIVIPRCISASPFDSPPGILNLPAMLVIAIVTSLLVIGTRESARTVLVLVTIKMSIIVIFIGESAGHMQAANWHPFLPYGIKGVLTASSVVFLGFTGFDAITTAAEESLKPQRDLPIGILVSIAAVTIIYIATAAVMIGVVPYRLLDVADPMTLVLQAAQHPWVSRLVGLAAIVGMTSVLLVLLFGLPRIIYAMSRDGLVPAAFSQLHPRFKTPVLPTALGGLCASCLAAFLPMHTMAELCSAGVLFALMMVSAGVLILRFRRPELHRPFRIPAARIICPLCLISCGGLMLSLPAITWLRFAAWLLLGFAVYWCYGRNHSRLGSIEGGQRF